MENVSFLKYFTKLEHCSFIIRMWVFITAIIVFTHFLFSAESQDGPSAADSHGCILLTPHSWFQSSVKILIFPIKRYLFFFLSQQRGDVRMRQKL